MTRGFTADDAARATTALRQALGKGPEAFPLPVFVGMISDEVEGLRAAGRSDAEIVMLLAEQAGVTVSADDLARFYAPPEARRRG